MAKLHWIFYDFQDGSIHAFGYSPLVIFHFDVFFEVLAAHTFKEYVVGININIQACNLSYIV